MKRLLFILFILFANRLSFCQSQSGETLNRFSIGINYSFDRTYRVLKNATNNEINQGIKESRDNREIPSLNYSTGLSIDYKLNKKFSVETGVFFTKNGYQTKEVKLVFSDLQDPRQGFVIDSTNQPVNEKLITEQSFITIPLAINILLIRKKIQFFVHAGLSTNIFLYEESRYEWMLEDGTTDVIESGKQKFESFTKVNMGVLLGFGANYLLNDKYIVQLKPIYRQSFTSIVNQKIKEYPNSIGLNVGVSYVF